MYEVFNVDDTKWNEIIKRFSIEMQDIYFSSQYYKMHQINGDGVAKAFFYEDLNGDFGFYPFLINEIKCLNLTDKYYDIESAYGYGGPLVSNRDSSFLNKFESEFMHFCIEYNIVAEFIRFHPLIENHSFFKSKIKTIYNRKTVCIDLSKGSEKVWLEDITSKNRNMIRKAIKNNLSSEISSNYDSFLSIYKETMQKVNATNYYYFNDKYFKSLFENKDCKLFNIKRENKVIASAIFMGWGDYFHYHLAGSIKNELKYSPNNLLLWSAIEYASKNNYKKMHLGGGLSDERNDNLFKFKKSFSQNLVDFYIGKRIHNEDVYNSLILDWEKKNNEKAHLFLQYKQ